MHDCRHFVALTQHTSPCGNLDLDETSVEGFYQRLGMDVLGTVVDGDCGLDVACQMLGLPDSAEGRGALRAETR